MIKATGGEAVVKTLQERGITDAFGIVGSSILEIFNLLPKAGINYYGVRHEQIAALMADGYGRVAQRPAVCLSQNGGGVTNLITGVANAQKAHSPMVVIGGTPSTGELDLDTFQETNQLGLMEKVTKWAGRVPRADRLPEYVSRAIDTALAFPMGPAYIEIPRDMLYELIEINDTQALKGQIETRTAPYPEALEKATKLLASARRPVIVAGAGVVWSGASDAVCVLGERLNAPMLTSYYHNDAIPSTHPWALGSLGRGGSKAAMKAFEQADLVLALGTSLDRFGLMPQYGLDYVAGDRIYVQVDIDPLAFNRSISVDLGIASDVGAYVDAQLTKLGETHSEWQAPEVEALKSDWAEELDQVAAVPAPTDGAMANAAVHAIVHRVIPDTAIRVTDIGSTPSYAYRMASYAKPRTLLAPGYLGSLGFGYSAAIGASIAAPDETVVALLGDGSLTMMLPALYTAAEYNTNLLAIVFDNGVWGAEWKNQDVFNDGQFVGSELDSGDLTKVTAAMGIWTHPRVEKISDVAPALEQALKRTGPRVVVIEVDRWSLPAPARLDALHLPDRQIYT